MLSHKTWFVYTLQYIQKKAMSVFGLLTAPILYVMSYY